MTETETQKDSSSTRTTSDLLGAIGLPLGIVAALIALIPFVGVFLFWVPGGAAVALGGMGLWRDRTNRRGRRLSRWALGLGITSFAITGGWFVFAALIGILSDQWY